jgi:hypothetical protein
MTVGRPNRPLGGQRRFRPHDAAPAFDAFEKRGLLAANIGPCALPHLDVEPIGRAGDARAQQAVAPGSRERSLHYLNRVRIFRADIDVALGGADRDAGDGHPLDQDEGITLHDHAVREGPAVAFIGIADDVLLRRRGLRHGAPFDAGRKAGAAASAQARLHHLFDDGVRSEQERALEPAETAVGLVVGDRERIDDAASREGQPRLAFQPRNVINDTVLERMRSALAARGIEQACGIGGSDRAIADTPRRGRDLDQGLQPIKPAGAGPHDLKRNVARGRRVPQRARDFIRPDRKRTRIAGNENAKALFWDRGRPARCPRERRGRHHCIEARFVEPADDTSADHRRRRGRAEPQTVDRLKRHAAVRRSRAHADAKPRLRARRQRIAAGRLAGFGATELDDVAARRLATKVMIEGDDAVHFGARQV